MKVLLEKYHALLPVVLPLLTVIFLEILSNILHNNLGSTVTQTKRNVTWKVSIILSLTLPKSHDLLVLCDL